MLVADKNPKQFDQLLFTKNGKLTNKGLFFKAAKDFKYKRKERPELVCVYEKINNNVWSDKSWFKLFDAELNHSFAEKRKVFKFILLPEGSGVKMRREEIKEFEFSHRIPTEVKGWFGSVIMESVHVRDAVQKKIYILITLFLG